MVVRPQTRHRRGMHAQRVVSQPMPAPGPSWRQTVIPFDYAATFALTGTPGNLVQDVINFDIDSVFVATAIGYGLDGPGFEALTQELLNGPPDPCVPSSLPLRAFPPQALIQGFRVNQRFLNTIFDLTTLTDNEIDADELVYTKTPASLAVLGSALEQAQRTTDFSFMFSMVDTDSGRELQDEPTHNVASLGISNGERPFRTLARPMYFMPRSTMRMQIEERSEGVTGTLFIVLYGYKLLSTGCPEPVVRSIHGPAFCRTETIGNPSDKIIPFDYVTKFQLTGLAGNDVEDEVAINVEGGFVATTWDTV